jgi:hypothetical protein
MASTTPRQRKTTGRVMHEFKHGELKSGPAGKGGKVKNRRQAIAIALKEAGASKYESGKANKRNLAKSERKEARGDTFQQEKEGALGSGLDIDQTPGRPCSGACGAELHEQFLAIEVHGGDLLEPRP